MEAEGGCDAPMFALARGAIAGLDASNLGELGAEEAASPPPHPAAAAAALRAGAGFGLATSDLGSAGLDAASGCATAGLLSTG